MSLWRCGFWKELMGVWSKVSNATESSGKKEPDSREVLA